MRTKPDDPCRCGSKKSYRNCCKKKNDRSTVVIVIVLIFGGIVLAKALFQPDSPVPAAPPGKIWSEEHGHYHDMPGLSTVPPVQGSPQAGGVDDPSPAISFPTGDKNVPQPDGPVPEGKVWSSEHGHWHNATNPSTQPSSPTATGGSPTLSFPTGDKKVPQPPGPVPAGKVWSSEHGHWHNAPKP